MCFGGSSPSAPAAPIPPPAPPVAASQAIQGAGASQMLAARAAAGQSSTILTGPQGLTTPATGQPKALLGQ